MANNRDPRKRSRINRNRLTSSYGRAARSKASAADTPRPTSSATRSSRTSGRAVVTQSGARGQRRGASGPRNPPVQGPSRKTPNAITGDTGRRGKPSPKGYPKPPKGKGGAAARTAARVAKSGAGRSLLKAGAKAVGLFGVLEGMFPAKAADGTLKGKKSRPNTQKPKAKSKPKAKPLSKGAKSFDKAFAAARKSGKSVFTWRGKKYNTKYKGE